MACQWQNCWCDIIRKLWAPGGCAWMMSTVCVIIMLFTEAPMGVLPQRQHSPWWASTRTITSCQPVVTVEAFMCQCVNCVNLPIFQSVLTFHCLLLCFFSILHIPCCEGHHYSSAISECWKCQWHAAAGVKTSQTGALYCSKLAQYGTYYEFNLASDLGIHAVYIGWCCGGGWGSSDSSMIYSPAESKSMGGICWTPLISPSCNPHNPSSQLYFLQMSLLNSVISVANNTWVFNPPMPGPSVCVSVCVRWFVCVSATIPSPSGPSI